MIVKLFKNIWFMSGILFIVLLLGISFAYPHWIDPYIKPPPEMLYKNGTLVDVPPYPPSLTYFFGVNRFGGDVFWMVIDGAKYTILIAIGVGILRILFGVVGGIVYGFYQKQLSWFVEPFTRAFRFVPAVLIAMIFMSPFLSDVSPATIFKQCLILAFIAFLPITSVIGREVNHYLKNEFIQAAILLGSSKWRLIKKHILVYLRPRLFILVVQQINQALLLLIHLGIFNFVIGGLKMIEMGQPGETTREVGSSLSNELTGLIGLSYRELQIDPWIVIGPSIGFVLIMLAFNLILHGLQKVIEERPVYQETQEGEDLQDLNTNKGFTLVK